MIEGVLEAILTGILDWIKSKGTLGKIFYGLLILAGLALVVYAFIKGKN